MEQPSILVKILHSIPHVNYTFRRVNDTFNPDSDVYLEFCLEQRRRRRRRRHQRQRQRQLRTRPSRATRRRQHQLPGQELEER
ncbi:hypothetical protein AWZ03_014099 [Drosophila navojoa]|uniref:Uncharacterized protein n=1 Tax=Drosophila navojoa TaxID=7232 RepID=A0A484AV45_DRONA|nr:hypothetical protein AWZ03_014099 [Drosophila navojoa]